MNGGGLCGGNGGGDGQCSDGEYDVKQGLIPSSKEQRKSLALSIARYIS